MAPRRPTKGTDKPPQRPNLVVPRAEAEQKIAARITAGCQLRDSSIHSQADLEKARNERSKWDKYNIELLQRLFNNDSIADEYERSYGMSIGGYPDLSRDIREFRENVDDKITRLEAILERLELIPELTASVKVASESQPPPVRPSPATQTINIHGGTVNIAQTGTGDVTQHNAATTNLAEVRQMINALIAAIGDLDAPEDERESFVAPVETLKAELRQSRPLAGRLLAAYGAVQAFGTVESAWQGWERVQRISSELAPHLHQLIQTMTQGQ